MELPLERANTSSLLAVLSLIPEFCRRQHCENISHLSSYPALNLSNHLHRVLSRNFLTLVRTLNSKSLVWPDIRDSPCADAEQP